LQSNGRVLWRTLSRTQLKSFSRVPALITANTRLRRDGGQSRHPQTSPADRAGPNTAPARSPAATRHSSKYAGRRPAPRARQANVAHVADVKNTDSRPHAMCSATIPQPIERVFDRHVQPLNSHLRAIWRWTAFKAVLRPRDWPRRQTRRTSSDVASTVAGLPESGTV